jgi:hypothetical protein
MTKIFDTSTVKGIKAAERFKARMNERFESVNVYAIGLFRIQIIALGDKFEKVGIRWPDGLQNY